MAKPFTLIEVGFAKGIPLRLLTVAAIGLFAAACSWHDPPGLLTPTPPPNPRLGQETRYGGPFVSDTAPIAIGDRVEGTVNRGDPQCWPDWDMTGVCLVYSLVAPDAGTVTATLTWPFGEPMDVLFVLAEGGSTIWDAGSKPKATVTPGQKLWVVVMSYSAPQDFVLETAFQR